MFKKRKVKNSSLKRTRDDLPQGGESKFEDTDLELEIQIARKEQGSEVDTTNNDNELPVTSEEPVEINNRTETGKKNASFNPDLIVDEQHQLLKENKEKLKNSSKIQEKDADGNKLYTGMISKQSKKEVLVKPVSSHVKQNFIMDYQRDVCKDFLKNGYCGFGDTCKFLHYREEFKTIESKNEKEWETAAKRRKKF
jgi:hypothetical protein